jgi:hypothetical protein
MVLNAEIAESIAFFFSAILPARTHGGLVRPQRLCVEKYNLNYWNWH